MMHRTVGGRRDLPVAGVIGLLLFVWHLPGLTLTPAINHDEVMLNAPAREWVERGNVSLPQLAEFGNTYGDAYYWHPPGHITVMAGAYRLFGFSIATTRGVSLASGAVTLALLYLVLRRAGHDSRWAALGCALFATHPLVWWLCRSGRMDFLALGCVLQGTLIWLGNGRDVVTWQRAAWSAAWIGFGALFHVMALVWAAALLAAESLKRREIPWRIGFVAAAVAATPLVTWIAVVFLRGDGAAWREQFLGYAVAQRSSDESWWMGPWTELRLAFDQWRWVPFVPLVLGAGISLAIKRRLASAWWTGGAVVAFLLIACGTAKGTGAYPLHWFLWMMPLALAGLAGMKTVWRAWLLAAAIANAAVFQAAQVGVALYQRDARSSERVDEFFRTHISAGDVVLGPEDIWYAVEKAGAHLRIWTEPDPSRHDFVVTYANVPLEPVPGFVLVAELPDKMPKVAGRYWSHSAFAYRVWRAVR